MSTSTVSRMTPGEAQSDEALQGWAMACTPPTSAQIQPVDLLFVHGMASGGWIWDDEWLQRFAAAGYRCWTITLPGRNGGSTIATDPHALERILDMALNEGNLDAARAALLQALPGMSLLDGPGLEDFTDAIAQSLDQIGRPTAVICHSLGGAAAQNLLRRGRRPAATVLMASVPPYGLWRASMEMAFLNPDLYSALMDFGMAGLTPRNIPVMRANLFPTGISDTAFNDLLPKMTDESLRAMTQALGMPPFAPMPGPRNDMLVIGAEYDRFVPMADVWGTAMYYGTLPKIIPDAGHVLMLGHAAEKVTAEILEFLDDLFA